MSNDLPTDHDETRATPEASGTAAESEADALQGIISFSAKPYTGNTLAYECATLQGEAASQADAVLMNFTWKSAGMKDGGEIQVDNSYGGSDDLQNIPANGNVYFEFDCFQNDGTMRTTSYQLVLSTGTTRHAAQIVLSAVGPVGGMTALY